MKRIFFILIFMVFSLNSQTSDSFDDALNIVGWVYSDDKPLRGAEVLVFRDNVTVEKHKTNRRGRFIIDLPLGDTYTLSISNPGLVRKKILFDTQVTPQQTFNSEFYFDFVLDLFDSIPWIDKNLLQAPLITIAFDQIADNFTYNQAEYELLRHQLDVINMVAAMYETKGQEYRNWLMQAEKYYLNGSLDEAYRLLSEAKSIFEGDTFLQNRMLLVERALHDEQLAKGDIVVEIGDPITANNQFIFSAPEFETVETANLQIENPAYVSRLHHHVRMDSLVFYSALDTDNIIEVGQGVFFMVQVLATSHKTPRNFFSAIIEQLPGEQIVLYHDIDGLKKYAVGKYYNLEEAIETLRILRQLNYDTFIVAFANDRRVRVNEALAIQNRATR